MLEVVFGESAEGTLKYAQHCRENRAFYGKNMMPEKEEQMKCRKRALLGEDTGDVFCFGSDYSIGDISQDGLSQNRVESMEHLFSVFPKSLAWRKRAIQKSAENLEQLIKRAEQGESVRIWYSEQPYDYCGICWLIAQLKSRMKTMPVLCGINLPNVVKKGDTLCSYMGWGGVPPEEIYAFLPLETTLSPACITAALIKWQEMQEKNSALRVVLNGNVQSVAENFYDPFIADELDKMDEEFSEAKLIGNVMGKYQLGIGDEWIALRIEAMIKAGKLLPITESEPDGSIYRRNLKKLR